ncbi:hypothetical protein DSO57_1018066 [Entomophthora muscae]|uniref:Uncharacterized protein n=1 Tax=Entomophthora muscae TaxID=34485 RepID=A0ACC2S684_9FUNG|nr:hypothetical protein DSO57_1018066 [Entomophthora muscae]
MSTPLHQAVMPKPPPEPSSSVVATPINFSSAAIKFWASQSVGTFSGKGLRAWLYFFEDYCDTFNLPDLARLREVGSKLRNNARIWHHDMLFKPGRSGKLKLESASLGIPTFENALIPAYARLICKANPATLEEAYNIVCENYAIYVERELDRDVKATSKWNPFSSSSKKKEPSIAETIEAKFKDMQSQFEAIYLAHEHPSCGPRPMQGPYVFTGNCYNCSNQGHKSKRCTKPCSICKSTDHTNFSYKQCMGNTTQRPIAVMMADQYCKFIASLALDKTVFPCCTKKTAQSPAKPLNSLNDLAHTVDERFLLAYPAGPPALVALA